MVRRIVCCALAGAVSLFQASPTRAQPPPHAIFVRAVGAPGAMPMTGLDGYVSNRLSTLIGPGAQRVSWDEIGTRVVVGGEAGYMLDPRWSVGVGVTTTHATTSSIFGSLFFDGGSTSLTADITEVTANATFWVPGGRGLFAGLEAGTGFGRLDEDFSYSTQGGDALVYNGRWKGNGFVSGMFAGFQHRVRAGLLAMARIGYKSRNLGLLPGQRTTTTSTYSAYPTGVEAGPIRDSMGRALESNFSIAYVGLGLGWEFGGR